MLLQQGIFGSNGIAIARAFLYQEQEIIIDTTPITPDKINNEIIKLSQAGEKAKEQISRLRDKALAEAGEEQAKIFEAHLTMLSDPALWGEMGALIKSEHITAGYAVKQVVDRFVAVFRSMDDEYMKERAADIADIGGRLLRNVLGITAKGLDYLDSEVIIIAHDLTPSDTMALNRDYAKGFAVNVGGRTSHAAIMARTLEIPAVLGLKDITGKVKDGELVILDGITGAVIVSPTPELLTEYKEKQRQYYAEQAELKKVIPLPAVTTDGRRVEIAANIGTPRDIDAVIATNGDGVGLYRSEFLYMDKDCFPSEEEQFAAYRIVAQKLGGKPVIIRTLDIGGDKELKCFPMPPEMNPFLGWRAIRLCLAEKAMFMTQLRAILRASAYGNIMIMYPMISGLTEVRQANAVLAEAKEQLRSERVPFNENIKVGIMVEIPSTAVIADLIAPEVDFFSIGTNDLCQYTLAVDRMNEKISYLYQPLHPAILRLIKRVIDASHQYGKFTGMCGELAGDPLPAIILLGLGLDEFSMSASSMPRIKKIIRSVAYEQAKAIATPALDMATPQQVAAYAAGVLKDWGLS